MCVWCVTHGGCSLLGKPLLFLQFLEQLPLWGILQDQVDSPAVIEIPIQSEYVGVPEEKAADK